MKQTELFNSEKQIILSHQFSKSRIKNISLIISIIVNVVLSIVLLKTWENATTGASITILCYILLTTLYDYFLIKSKVIKFDRQYIFIENSQNEEKISVSQIFMIKRIYFFFYKIHYKNNSGEKKEVYFFISPNPSIKEPEKIKILKGLIHEKNN